MDIPRIPLAAAKRHPVHATGRLNVNQTARRRWHRNTTPCRRDRRTGPLHLAIEAYAARCFHLERNHQGLGDRLIDGEPAVEPATSVESRERLGGILRSYRREA